MTTLMWILGIVVGFWAINKYEKLCKCWATAQNNAAYLSARIETLEQFICESRLLKNDLKLFTGKKYVEHGYMPRIVGAEPRECLCSELRERTRVLNIKAQFYSSAGESRPDGEPYMDGYTEYLKDMDFKKVEVLSAALLPHLKTLEELERKENNSQKEEYRVSEGWLSIPSHICWVENKRHTFGDFYVYAKTVLIPSLRNEGDAVWNKTVGEIVSIVDAPSNDGYRRTYFPSEIVDPFEELCVLASTERWGWDLYSIGQEHFRYAFLALAQGKSPANPDWEIHIQRTDYSSSFGAFPHEYSSEQIKKILEICVYTNITAIAKKCKFPNWLGYLGLVLAYMRSESKLYRQLSSAWAEQLLKMVAKDSESFSRLTALSEDKYKKESTIEPLNIYDLQRYEIEMDPEWRNRLGDGMVDRGRC